VPLRKRNEGGHAHTRWGGRWSITSFLFLLL
jgi:hypothetical protein